MKVEFYKQRETKNTVRYEEKADPPAIGVLYVQKWAAKSLATGEYPEKIVLEINAA